MTAKEIGLVLCSFHHESLWNPRQYWAVRNSVNVVGWEADLLLISRASKCVTEVEIKISVADFKNEFTKDTKIRKHDALKSGVLKKAKWMKVGHGYEHRHHHQNYVRNYYFAVPESIADKVKPLLPEYAGLIVVSEHINKDRRFLHARKVVKAPTIKSEKATDLMVLALKESLYYRYWNESFKDARGLFA